MEFEQIKPPYLWEPLKDLGLSNDLFLINQTFFVKKSKIICHKFLNLNNQLKILKIVQNKNYTLPILEAKITDEHLWVLMYYYKNILTLQSYSKYSQQLLLEVSQLIKELHKTIVNYTTPSWNPLEQLNTYCNLIKTEFDINPIKTELSKWLKTYQPKDVVLCHNDLTINNFVTIDKRWYLIDWDFACLNDRLFDIASFVSETLEEENDIKYWYEIFNINEKELEIINKWIKYQNLIWYYWGLYLFHKTNNEMYKTIANKKLKKLVD